MDFFKVPGGPVVPLDPGAPDGPLVPASPLGPGRPREPGLPTDTENMCNVQGLQRHKTEEIVTKYV